MSTTELTDAAALAVAPATPELAALRPLVGRWTCRDEYPDLPPAQVAHTAVASCLFWYDLGGNWLHVRCDETRASNGQALYSYDEFHGFDPGRGKYVRTFHGSLGDRGLSTADSFNPAESIWVGTVEVGGGSFETWDRMRIDADGKTVRFNGTLAGAPLYTFTCRKAR